MIINWFKKELGEEFVSDHEHNTLAYSTDASQIKGNTNLVAWPGSAKDIHNIILFVKRNKQKLLIRGAGSNLFGGSVPKGHIVLDMRRMSKIWKINEVDKSVIVEAGISVNELNHQLDGLFFPFKSENNVSTIGGSIAVNASGLYGLKYGKIMNWIIGLEILDGNGRSWIVGKDKIKDFCGREGLTGVIVRAKLKVIKMPEKRTMSVIKFSNAEDLVDAARNITDATAIEFIDDIISNYLDLGKKYHLIVEYDNNKGEIKDKNEIERWWKIRNNVHTILHQYKYNLPEDPWVPQDKMIDLLYWFRSNNIPVYGHIGNGVLHPYFERNSEKINKMVDIIKTMGGRLGKEFNYGLLRRKLLDHASEFELKELVNKYNTEKIFNEGRVL